MQKLFLLFFLLISWQVFSPKSSAQSLSSSFYEIGSPTLTEYYVDPTNGHDSNSGTASSAPRRSVSSIWNDIPTNSALSTGVRINLLPGTYTSEHLPNYWENRTGTALAPIILRAAQGYGTVFFTRDINMSGVSYFYLLEIDIKNRTSAGYGDAFHAERSDHILLRANSFNGAPNGRNAGEDVAHETIKFNQSRNIYIENNNIQGAEDNGIDFVAVYDGHIRANRIHDTQSWCMYVKGGSSYLLVEGNLVYDCGEGGITAGQGTGFEFMDDPFLRYEANYIKIINNIIHDVTGAALGVNGGYNILVAHNTAYKVGSRSHLIEVVFGERSCDGDIAACQARQAAGGWGPAATGSEASQPIGNRNVSVVNNVLYNPSGFVSGSQHFAIYGPRTPTVSGIPSPQLSDSGLVIKGNIVWNGGSSMPVGVEDADQGCQPSNPTCSLAQLLANNSINSSEPDFLSASTGDFRPMQGGRLSAIASVALDDFSVLESEAGPITEGDRNNQVTREFSGTLASARPPGAIVSASSSIEFSAPSADETTPPAGGGGGSGGTSAPKLKITKVTAKNSGGKVAVTVSAKASDGDGVSSVQATVLDGSKMLGSVSQKIKAGVYSGKKSFKTKAKKVNVRVVATDSTGQSTSKSKKVKVS